MHLVWNIEEYDVIEDMINEYVLVDDEEHEVAPLGEGWRGEIEDDRDEVTHVENVEGLRVEGNNNIGITSGWRNVDVVDHDAIGGSLLEAATCVG
jgi:hypothetical protein